MALDFHLEVELVTVVNLHSPHIFQLDFLIGLERRKTFALSLCHADLVHLVEVLILGETVDYIRKIL